MIRSKKEEGLHENYQQTMSKLEPKWMRNMILERGIDHPKINGSSNYISGCVFGHDIVLYLG